MGRKPLIGVLAENLQKIFSARGITAAVAAAEEIHFPKTTLDRIWKADGVARLDKVEALAHKLSLQAWQLLVPNVDPYHLPRLSGDPAPTSDIARQLGINMADYESLSETDKAELRGMIRGFMIHATLPRKKRGNGKA